MQPYPINWAKIYLASYRYVNRQCYYGFLLNLCQSIFIGIYYYLSIYFISVLHLSVTTSGVIIAFYGIGSILGSMLSGMLSDRWSPGIISAICLFIQAIAYTWLIQAQSHIFLILGMIILGIASYGFITANHLFVLSYCDDGQRLKALNILSMSSNFGLGLSAVLITSVIVVGFHEIFFIAAMALVILSLITLVINKRYFVGDSLKKIQNSSSKESNESSSKNANKTIATLILACIFFVGLIVAQLSTTYSIYIKVSYPELGLNSVAILFAINSFIVVFLSVPCGNLIKKYNKIMMVGVGGFFIGISMTLLIFHSYMMAMVACIVYTLGEIIFFSVAQLVCYQNGEANKKGKSLGSYRMIYASSRILGPVIGSILYTKFGAFIIWIISGVIGVACLIACNYFKKYD